MANTESRVPAKRQVAFEVAGANSHEIRANMIMCGMEFLISHPRGEPDKALLNPRAELSEEEIEKTRACLRRYYGAENVTLVPPQVNQRPQRSISFSSSGAMRQYPPELQAE